MIYKNYEELNIINVGNSEFIQFCDLKELLESNPSNVIYLVYDNKLKAIVSMGDVFRAKEQHKSAVEINTNFTYMVGRNDIQARAMFFNKSGINEIPVVDKYKRLIGSYARWNDYVFMPVFENMLKHFYSANSFFSDIEISLVVPKNKSKLGKFKEYVETLKKYVTCKLAITDTSDLSRTFDQSDFVVFLDEDELRGIGTLCNEIISIRFDWRKAQTFRSLTELLDAYEDQLIGIESLNELLSEIKRKGVDVLLIKCADNGSSYYKRITNEIEVRCKREGRDKSPQYLVPDWYESFFCELYTESYADEISHHHFATERKNGIRVLTDYKSRYFNVINNERITIGKCKSDRKIWFVGPCLIVGHLVEDKNTIESYLQEIINKNNHSAEVVNLGSWSTPLEDAYRISNLKVNEGDIVIVYAYNPENIVFSDTIEQMNIVDVLDENNVPSSYFDDMLVHGNHIANFLYAQKIYQLFEEKLKSKSLKRTIITCSSDEIMIKAYIKKYFSCANLEELHSSNKKIGSIVMNGNPFTKGHRFLIEYALSVVDELIIFVVEEDASLFSFEERYAMIIEGTRDLPNVIVVPSGWYILSKKTFPEYFIKESDENLLRNVEYDIKLFAQYIAPKLRITFRFVGGEPLDAVTNEYNKAMARILEKYGIKLVEIPRIDNRDGIISATKVRSLIEANDFEKLKLYVPPSSLKYLLGSSC